MTYLETGKSILNRYKTTVDDWKSMRGSKNIPPWLAEKIVNAKNKSGLRKAAREAIKLTDEKNIRHLFKYYRSDCSFVHYQVVAKLVHSEMGYTGEQVRKITRAIIHDSKSSIVLMTLPVCIEPVYWQNGYPEDHERRMARNIAEGRYDDHKLSLTEDQIAQISRWILYARWHAAKAIGEYEALQLLERLKNPIKTISGYLADSIVSWQTGKSGYEGCNGYEYACYLKQHPEHWDFLLSRAPTGAKGNGWEQTFPHERDRMQKLRAMGYIECLRLSDSIWAPSASI